ncbi:TIGR04222 domain-containing membrane protein, partial [Candidatus Frankia alpina]
MAIAIGYIALVIVLSIVVIATRWAVRRGAPDPDLADAGERDGTRPDRLRPRRSTLDRFGLDADGLGPLPGQAEELAMLAGSPQLAALAGVVALRDSGSVEKGGLRGTLVSRRPAPRENRTLRQAIHHRIAEHGPLEVAQLGKLLADDPAMIELRTRLSRDGLLPTVQQERLLRWCRPTALVLATLGFILGLSSTSLTDSANSAPILIIGVIGSLVLAAGAPPRLPGLADGSLSGQHALAV